VAYEGPVRLWELAAAMTDPVLKNNPGLSGTYEWLAYRQQRKNCRRRNIPFLLSFEAWLNIWHDSGHFKERGVFKGQYVMARFGDVGPYSADNVKIVINRINQQETVHTVSSRKKRRLKMLGQKRTLQVRNNISRSKTGYKNPQFGKKRSAAIRAKISLGMIRYKAEHRTCES
jgi:hypothetical protein